MLFAVDEFQRFIRADSVDRESVLQLRDLVAGRIEEEYGETLPIDIPEGLRLLALSVTARIWTNPTQLRAKGTGPFSWTYADVELTADERRRIRGAAGRGSRVLSVPMSPLLDTDPPWLL